MTACLRSLGKIPAERERLINVVIGSRRVSRQDLRSFVGVTPREHEALEADNMACRTSSLVAGVNEDRYHVLKVSENER